MAITMASPVEQSKFSILGHRKDYYFGNVDQKLTKAIVAIDKLLKPGTADLLATQSGLPIYSVEDLVHLIYENEIGPPELDDIREAVKSRSLVMHCFSGTGNVVLAYLAYLKNPKCMDIDEHGNGIINLDITKETIRSFFSNPDTIQFDDKALCGLKVVEGKFTFGKRGIDSSQASDDVTKIDSIAQYREVITGFFEQYFAPFRKTQTIHIDLNALPKLQTKKGVPDELAIGDAHGNVLLILHELVAAGHLKIKNEAAWNALVEKIRNLEKDNDNESPIELNDQPAAELSAIDPIYFTNALKVTAKSKGKKITLLGDLVADRMGRDDVMISLLSFLHENNVNYKIIFSNHDADFVEFILKYRKTLDNEDYFISSDFGNVSDDQRPSFVRLIDLLNQKKELRPAFFERVDRAFLDHLVLFSLGEDGKRFNSHAVVTKPIFDAIANKANVRANLPIADKINAINQWFKGIVLPDVDLLTALCKKPNAEYSLEYTENPAADPFVEQPLYGALWNRVLGDSNLQTLENKNAAGQKFEAIDPSILIYCHGHTEEVHAVLVASLNEEKALNKLKGIKFNAATFNEHLHYFYTNYVDATGSLVLLTLISLKHITNGDTSDPRYEAAIALEELFNDKSLNLSSSNDKEKAIRAFKLFYATVMGEEKADEITNITCIKLCDALCAEIHNRNTNDEYCKASGSEKINILERNIDKRIDDELVALAGQKKKRANIYASPHVQWVSLDGDFGKSTNDVIGQRQLRVYYRDEGESIGDESLSLLKWIKLQANLMFA